MKRPPFDQGGFPSPKQSRYGATHTRGCPIVRDRVDGRTVAVVGGGIAGVIHTLELLRLNAAEKEERSRAQREKRRTRAAHEEDTPDLLKVIVIEAGAEVLSKTSGMHPGRNSYTGLHYPDLETARLLAKNIFQTILWVRHNLIDLNIEGNREKFFRMGCRTHYHTLSSDDELKIDARLPDLRKNMKNISEDMSPDDRKLIKSLFPNFENVAQKEKPDASCAKGITAKYATSEMQINTEYLNWLLRNKLEEYERSGQLEIWKNTEVNNVELDGEGKSLLSVRGRASAEVPEKFRVDAVSLCAWGENLRLHQGLERSINERRQEFRGQASVLDQEKRRIASIHESPFVEAPMARRLPPSHSEIPGGFGEYTLTPVKFGGGSAPILGASASADKGGGGLGDDCDEYSMETGSARGRLSARLKVGVDIDLSTIVNPIVRAKLNQSIMAVYGEEGYMMTPVGENRFFCTVVEWTNVLHDTLKSGSPMKTFRFNLSDTYKEYEATHGKVSDAEIASILKSGPTGNLAAFIKSKIFNIFKMKFPDIEGATVLGLRSGVVINGGNAELGPEGGANQRRESGRVSILLNPAGNGRSTSARAIYAIKALAWEPMITAARDTHNYLKDRQRMEAWLDAAMDAVGLHRGQEDLLLRIKNQLRGRYLFLSQDVMKTLSADCAANIVRNYFPQNTSSLEASRHFRSAARSSGGLSVFTEAMGRRDPVSAMGRRRGSSASLGDLLPGNIAFLPYDGASTGRGLSIFQREGYEGRTPVSGLLRSSVESPHEGPGGFGSC